MEYFSQSNIDRFWSKVDIRSADECWEWKGGKTKDGYGLIGIGRGAKTAHRFVKELERGEVIERKFDSSHLCDSRSCCNPAHLIIETRAENMNRIPVERRSRMFNNRKPRRDLKVIRLRAKVTQEIADEIKRAKSEKRAPNGLRSTLAAKYGISVHTVDRIWAGTR